MSDAPELKTQHAPSAQSFYVKILVGGVWLTRAQLKMLCYFHKLPIEKYDKHPHEAANDYVARKGIEGVEFYEWSEHPPRTFMVVASDVAFEQSEVVEKTRAVTPMSYDAAKRIVDYWFPERKRNNVAYAEIFTKKHELKYSVLAWPLRTVAPRTSDVLTIGAEHK